MEDALIKTLKKWLAQGRTSDVIQRLLEEAPKIGKHFQDEIILISNRFQTYEHNQRHNLRSDSELGIALAQINDSLLQLIRNPVNKTKVATHTASSGNRKLWLIGGIVGIVILLASWMIFSIGGTPDVQAEKGTVTVFVHGPQEGRNDLILKNKGKVQLRYDDAVRSKEIDENGQAIFNGIPISFFSEGARVEVNIIDTENEPFQPTNPDTTYKLESGKPIYLEVELKGLDQITGYVKDANTLEYIEGARVFLLELESFTDENGWFKIEIPFEKRRQFQTIRAYKKGYKEYLNTDVPIQTLEEEIILLEPVK